MATNPKGEINYGSPESYFGRHRYNPCALWSSFCSWYVCLLSRFFGWFGQGIAKHPLLTINMCIVFVGACSVGVFWFTVEDRRNKLFIPQQSKALDDLNAAEKYFRIKFRTEQVLLVASSSHPNVLSPDCLMQALQAHDAVVQLDSYSDYCVTLSGEKAKSSESCMMINPLEIFHPNQTNLINKELQEVQVEVNKAYNNETLVMRNGRPFQYNFNRMFGKVTRNDTTNEIISAEALQLVYLISDPSEREANKKVVEWEKTFIDNMASLEKDLTCFELHYSSERSLDDAIAESSGSDVTLVSITFTVMIAFAFLVLGKFLNPLTGHSLLASAGVFAVILGILAGSGLAMWCRVPFVSIVGVLPFLVLGIGIDDMFIIVDELDRLPPQLTVVEAVKEVMSRSGSTVTMTTLTDLVAFAVSTSTSFPAIRYFCVYGALMVTFSFLMMVTFFVAIMTYDIRRIKSGRRDCLPFCRAPPPKHDGLPWDEPLPQTSNRIMIAWANVLTLTGTKVFVVIFSVTLLAAGIYGVTQVDESFDRRILAKDGSYLKRFLSAQEDYFELSIEVSMVVEGEIDYGKQSTHDEIRELSNIVKCNKHYRNVTLSWMDAFSQYAKRNNTNITGPNFVTELKTFLNVSQHFRQDVKFSHDGDNMEASRILGFMKTSASSTFQKDAMLSLRQDLEQNSKLDVFPIVRPFIVFEQYAIISRETTRNLIIATIAVFIVTSPFLVDCTVTIIVVFNFVALICELFGLMVLWDVALNTVSMINLVMAIGFAVDYSAHIAHAYVISEKGTADERLVDSLSTVGASVFMGGFSTFLGMVVLAFAASELFRIFFRMFLGIVVFGLIHGLCILPVHLSLFCRRPVVIRPSSVPINVQSKKPSHEATIERAPGAVSNCGFDSGDASEAVETKHDAYADNRTEPQINTIGPKKGLIKEAGIQNKGFQRDDANGPDVEAAMKMPEHQNEELQTDNKENKKQPCSVLCVFEKHDCF